MLGWTLLWQKMEKKARIVRTVSGSGSGGAEVVLILHVFRGLCCWLLGDVNADRLGLRSGPTLLFEKRCRGGEAGRRFYACAACRDRKDCSFFQWEGEKVGFLPPPDLSWLPHGPNTAALM